jgi:hypothetical protein
MKSIEKVINKIINQKSHIDADASQEALAAIEIIAGLINHPSIDFPEFEELTLRNLQRKLKSKISQKTIDKSIQAVYKISTGENNELKELIDETDASSEWGKVLDDLIIRLKKGN